MKKIRNRIISALLTVLLLAVTIPITSMAAEDITVVVSMEGLTLGQGLYFAPKAYSLSEINRLIADDGYGPYDASQLTAGMATLAFLNDNGIEYAASGTWDSDVYLSGVAGIDTGKVDIPAVISEHGGPSNEDNTGNDDLYLGETDYGFMSGWMVTVNDFMIDTGCAQWLLEDNKSRELDGYNLGDTYVVRWQFSVSGFGADLGMDTGWGEEPYFDGAKKAPLYAAYAKIDDRNKKSSALSVMEKLTATQEEVDAALAALTAEDAYRTVLRETLAQLAVQVPQPQFGCEWSVLALARGEFYPRNHAYFSGYYQSVAQTAAEAASETGALSSTKSTENARTILALTAIGKDPTDVGGVDLVGAYERNGMEWVKKQGINGPVFALLALDCGSYVSTLRQSCVDAILAAELENGGWALGKTADPDMTAMALQALAPYRDQAAVAAAAEHGFAVLSDLQKQSGGWESWGSVNAESIAQVIVACTAWGIDPASDSRFVKDSSAVDALLDFYVPESQSFSHTAGGGYNAMATEQGAYALVAYDRMKSGKTALYTMIEAPQITGSAVSLSLPDKIENKAGSVFRAAVYRGAAIDGCRMMDCIVALPLGVQVTDVTMGSTLQGGGVSYHLEESTGKLRIVYFDPQGGTPITDSAGQFPAEMFSVGLRLAGKLEADGLQIAVTGMSLKESSAQQTIMDTSSASAVTMLTEEASYFVRTLYTGDDVDLISSKDTAIAVFAAGIEPGTALNYADSYGNVTLYASPELSEKSGLAAYVALVASDRSLEGLTVSGNYTAAQTGASCVFGDLNGDTLINAQDALNSVNLWLRKTAVFDAHTVLAGNVNCDSRLNTMDTLAIVERFVDGTLFTISEQAVMAEQ